MEVDFEKTVFFDFQKPSKIKGFRLRTRETANRILSPPRLPIPTHRQEFDYCFEPACDRTVVRPANSIIPAFARLLYHIPRANASVFLPCSKKAAARRAKRPRRQSGARYSVLRPREYCVTSRARRTTPRGVRVSRSVSRVGRRRVDLAEILLERDPLLVDLRGGAPAD